MRCQQGASAVEFALVLPLLLLLTFGIIEFGILLYDKAVITNASREGARAGIVFAADTDGNRDPKTEAEIQDIVMKYVNEPPLLINLGDVKKTLAREDITAVPDGPDGDYLIVTVTFDYDFLILPDLSALVGGTFDGTITLRGVTRMRME